MLSTPRTIEPPNPSRFSLGKVGGLREQDIAHHEGRPLAGLIRLESRMENLWSPCAGVIDPAQLHHPVKWSTRDVTTMTGLALWPGSFGLYRTSKQTRRERGMRSFWALGGIACKLGTAVAIFWSLCSRSARLAGDQPLMRRVTSSIRAFIEPSSQSEKIRSVLQVLPGRSVPIAARSLPTAVPVCDDLSVRSTSSTR